MISPRMKANRSNAWDAWARIVSVSGTPRALQLTTRPPTITLIFVCLLLFDQFKMLTHTHAHTHRLLNVYSHIGTYLRKTESVQRMERILCNCFFSLTKLCTYIKECGIVSCDSDCLRFAVMQLGVSESSCSLALATPCVIIRQQTMDNYM